MGTSRDPGDPDRTRRCLRGFERVTHQTEHERQRLWVGITGNRWYSRLNRQFVVYGARFVLVSEVFCSMRRRRVILLGATGSIGQSAIRVAEAFPDQMTVVGMA